MARILPVRTRISIEQYQTQNGNYYPACIFANPEFLERFENSLIVAKTFLEPETLDYKVVESLLNGLSNYQLHKEKQKKDLPTEIHQHFNLLPNIDSSIDMDFQPLNNVPTDVLLYSFDEIKAITDSLEIAMSKANDEQIEIISPIYTPFNSFLSEWIENKERTGSLFASQEMI